MKEQCLLYPTAHGRNALIGQNLIAVSSHCSPLIGQNLIAVSSHCHALCLPVGGASLANDGRSECGVNKCGEALRSTSRSALRCMPLCVCFYSTVVIVHTLALIFFFFFIYIYILLYFNIIILIFIY